MLQHKMIGKYPFHMSCMHTEHHNMLQQDFHHLYYYTADTQPHVNFATQLGYDSLSYPAQFQVKLAKLYDFIHTNLTQAAHSQKSYYDQRTKQFTFALGDPVWLSIPTAGKFDPRWESEWVIKSVKSPVTMEIYDSKRSKVVHISIILFQVNRMLSLTRSTTVNILNGPLHVILPPAKRPVPDRYPQRQRRPPDWYRP